MSQPLTELLENGTSDGHEHMSTAELEQTLAITNSTETQTETTAQEPPAWFMAFKDSIARAFMQIGADIDGLHRGLSKLNGLAEANQQALQQHAVAGNGLALSVNQLLALNHGQNESLTSMTTAVNAMRDLLQSAADAAHNAGDSKGREMNEAEPPRQRARRSRSRTPPSGRRYPRDMRRRSRSPVGRPMHEEPRVREDSRPTQHARDERRPIRQPGYHAQPREEQRRSPCKFCNTRDHAWTDKCARFPRISQRLAIVEERGLCPKCLDAHEPHACYKNDRCYYCKETSHHSAICQSEAHLQVLVTL